jgi:hypothetical protein
MSDDIKDIKVDYGIPIPDRATAGTNRNPEVQRYLNLIKCLKHGESFLVPNYRICGLVVSSWLNHRKKYGGPRLTTRVQPDRQVRIWVVFQAVAKKGA